MSKKYDVSFFNIKINIYKEIVETNGFNLSEFFQNFTLMLDGLDKEMEEKVFQGRSLSKIYKRLAALPAFGRQLFYL